MTAWSIDQERLSGANMEADWNGATLRGIAKLTINESVKRDRQYGNGSVAIGLPAGTHEADFELETIPEEADDILMTLGDQWSKTPGTIGITFVGDSIYTVNLSRVFLNDASMSVEAGGQKATTKTLKGYVLDPVDSNGLRALAAAGVGTFSLGPFSISF